MGYVNLKGYVMIPVNVRSFAPTFVHMLQPDGLYQPMKPYRLSRPPRAIRQRNVKLDAEE
jgi:hypothetical protein